VKGTKGSRTGEGRGCIQTNVFIALPSARGEKGMKRQRHRVGHAQSFGKDTCIHNRRSCGKDMFIHNGLDHLQTTPDEAGAEVKACVADAARRAATLKT